MDPNLAASLEEGNVEAVCKLISENKDFLESKNSNGFTPLLLAVNYGNLELVRALVDLGANIQALDPETGENSLHIAAKGDCRKIIKFLLTHGISIECTTNNGCTPLHIAANYGSVGSIRKLTRLGANINAKNVNGMTPLHIAAITDKRESVVALLEYVLPSLEKDTFGKTALDYAKEKFGVDNELTLSIADYGEVCFLYPFLKENEQIFRTKLAETEHKGGKLQFLIYKEAIENKRQEIIKVLLEEGVNPKITNQITKQTPLHVAAAVGVVSIIKQLIENEADIDAVDNEGNTPLHMAAQNCQYQAVSELITRGAIVKENNDGKTAIDLCRDSSDELPQKTKTFSYLVKMIGYNIAISKIENSKELLSFLKLNKKVIKKHGETLIFDAIAKDKADVVDFLLLNRVDSNCRDKEGKTPLICAVEQNKFEIAKQLLVYSADVNLTIESTGQTPLHIAAEKGYFDILELLLQNNAMLVDDANGDSAIRIAQRKLDEGNIDYEKIVNALCVIQNRDSLSSSMYNADVFAKQLKDSPGVIESYGPHLLREAIQKRYFDIVKILVEAGADINKNDTEGVNAVHEMAMSNSDEMMRYFLEKKGDLTLKEFHGRTPLLCACSSASPKTIKVLIEAGSLYALDDEGSTPMQLVVDCPETNKNEAIEIISDFTFETAKSKLTEEAELEEMLEQNAFLLRDKGSFFMQWAVTNKSTYTINFLISQGVSVSERDDAGTTVLITAVKAGDIDMIRVLVESGSITGVHDNDGRTPLHYAALGDNVEIVDYLIENGATNKKDNNGKTPLDLCSRRQSKAAKQISHSIRHLIEYFIEMDAAQNYHQFKEVFKKYRTKYGVHSAIRAISYNSKPHVEYLINHGLKPTVRDEKGMTLLHYAVPHCFEIAKFLIDKGANVNAQSEGGYTPLHIACKYQNNDDIIHLLIEHGADVNLTTKNNITPLFLAMKVGNTIAINSLLNKGADPNIRTETDLAPLDIAARRHNTEMIDILISKGADEVSLEETRMQELSIKEVEKQKIKKRRALRAAGLETNEESEEKSPTKDKTENKTDEASKEGKETKSTDEPVTPQKEKKQEGDQKSPKKEEKPEENQKSPKKENNSDESPNSPKKEKKNDEKADGDQPEGKKDEQNNKQSPGKKSKEQSAQKSPKPAAPSPKKDIFYQ